MPDQNSFLVAAYVVTWITLCGYAVYLHTVSRRSRRQLEEAKRGPDGDET
jgi:hypothetical protein